VPTFDALYLDMNGIIHNCTHGDPSDEAFQLTEDQMFKDIGDYISTLFRIIKPRTFWRVGRGDLSDLMCVGRQGLLHGCRWRGSSCEDEPAASTPLPCRQGR
jgi:hypothetical protein